MTRMELTWDNVKQTYDYLNATSNETTTEQ